VFIGALVVEDKTGGTALAVIALIAEVIALVFFYTTLSSPACTFCKVI
jgi:hypothetical protein